MAYDDYQRRLDDQRQADKLYQQRLDDQRYADKLYQQKLDDKRYADKQYERRREDQRYEDRRREEQEDEKRKEEKRRQNQQFWNNMCFHRSQSTPAVQQSSPSSNSWLSKIGKLALLAGGAVLLAKGIEYYRQQSQKEQHPGESAEQEV